MISSRRQDQNSAAVGSVDREASRLRYVIRDTCEILWVCWQRDTRCFLSPQDPADRRFSLPLLDVLACNGFSTCDREKPHPEQRVAWRNFPSCRTSALCRRAIAV